MSVVADFRRGAVRAALLAAVALSAALSGCVTIYEPLGGLQRPVVVDVRNQNFANTKIFVRCIPNKTFSSGDANELCRRVSMLLSNQGADVETTVPPDGEMQLVSFSTGKPDLVIDLTSRLLNEDESGVMAVLYTLSCSLIPQIDEQSFMQEISVRDGDGAVLGTTTLKSRFINYTGCGFFSINWVLDVLFRPKEEQLTGDGAKNDFSRDFYGQLSQVAFNGLVRERLLGEGPLPSTPPPTPNANPAVTAPATPPPAAAAAAAPPQTAPTPPAPAAAPAKPKPAAPPPQATDVPPLPPVLDPPPAPLGGGTAGSDAAGGGG